MTYIVLDRADEETMRGGLVTAHRNVEAKGEISGAKRGNKKVRG